MTEAKGNKLRQALFCCLFPTLPGWLGFETEKANQDAELGWKEGINVVYLMAQERFCEDRQIAILLHQAGLLLGHDSIWLRVDRRGAGGCAVGRMWRLNTGLRHDCL